MNRKFTLTLFTFLLGITISFGQNSYKIPSETWSLEIDLDGYKVEKEGFSPDSSMFQLSAINGKANINLSIFIERTDSKGKKEECREFYWSKAKNSPLAKENVQKYETENAAVVEHDTKEYDGQIINFHSLNAYLSQNGYWLDIHISKIRYSKKDKKAFNKILKSIIIKL
ncbi:MAG: hypothetical protein JKY54_19285 [Flavobacteriales bacterium]|nr:hypothetical protein [Flavobacteriales bacterium]